MKFIGQYIQDFIARFRSDVYLENISSGTIASGGSLGLDSNNKIVKASASAAPDADATTKGIVELATTAETTTGTDATRAVTPDGLKDGFQGSANIVAVGTITSGAWRGIAIDQTYLVGQSGTNTGDQTNVSGSSGTVTSIGNLTGDVTSSNRATTIAADAVTYAKMQNLGTANRVLGSTSTGVIGEVQIVEEMIADNAVTEDKIADAINSAIAANTAKNTNVSTNLTATTHASQITINSSDGDNVVVAEASGSIAGVMTVAHHDKLDGIETSATADQTKSDIDGLAITTVGTLDTGDATAIVSAASATVAGKVELATTAEATTGTDTSRAVTAAGVAAVHATSQTGKHKQIFVQNFVDDLGTDKHFMPFKTNVETTQQYQEESCLIAPFDGRVVSVTIGYAQTQNNPTDITVGVETIDSGVSYAGTWAVDEVQTETLTGNHHVLHFVFDDAKHFDSTNKIAISIQQAAAVQNAERFFWVSTIIEWDYSTALANDEYGSTP